MFDCVTQVFSDLAGREMFMGGSVYKIECFYVYINFSAVILERTL